MSSPIHCEFLCLPVSGGCVRLMVICLNTPDSTQNIVDRSFALEFGRAVLHAGKLSDEKAIDIVVVCSGKSNGFIAGADIKTMLSSVGPSGSLRIFLDTFKLNSLYCLLETLPVPMVAVINGTVLGAGLELVLSCDYRVIEQEVGKGVGQPEVKIGVLPGAGGCFRIPYLIGLRQALPILLTGDSITSKRALKLGLVDALWTHTQSISPESGSSDSGSGLCYKYEWVEELKECIRAGRIGKKKFDVKLGESGPLLENVIVHPQEISEEAILEQANLSWSKCDEKASRKFRYRPAIKPSLMSPLYCMLDYLFYAVSAVTLWNKVKGSMPAPYEALICTWRCYNTPSIEDAVVESSAAFARLVKTAESKSLMSLFLLARKLKKDSLVIVPSTIDPIGEVTVIAEARGIGYASAFVQSLLYSDVKVAVFIDDLDKKEVWLKLVHGIKKHFGYSVSRGHMTKETVTFKMRPLRQLAELEEDSSVIINTCLSKKKSTPFNKKIWSVIPSEDNQTLLLLHIGDPVRKNTLSVEIMTDGKLPEVGVASSLVSRMGKTPVITPLCSNIGLKLVVAHWTLVVEVAMVTGVKWEYLEEVLKGGGFSEGPFTSMRKLDQDVLKLIAQKYGTEVLASFTESSNTIRYKTTPTSKPHPQSLVNLFLINLVVTAVQLLTEYRTLSADTVDFIAVSGLVHFPPTEGGPVNYLKRNGRALLMGKLRDAISSNASNKPLQKLVTSLINRLENLDGKEINGCGLSLLKDSELKVIGPTLGVQHSSSILYPFLFNARPIYLFLFFLILFIILIVTPLSVINVGVVTSIILTVLFFI